MKVHYINILLFALPLYILDHNKRNHNSTTYHVSKTKPTKTYRTLCELYAPSNYENDLEIKELMENFNRQTFERFREYDEKMQYKRKQCKEQCNKHIQKIILKDKIEKDLTETFSTLQTKIDTNDIPTCICKKSLADKVQKTCLKCGGVLGGGLAPELGLIGGTALYGISVWKPKAITAAIAAAQKSGEAAGNAAGLKAALEAVIDGLYDKFILSSLHGKALQDIVTTKVFINPNYIAEAVKLEKDTICWKNPISETHETFCSIADQGTYPGWFNKYIEANSETIFTNASKAAAKATESTTQKITEAAIETNTGAVESLTTTYYTAIIASIVAILVIILIMFIIYLILRYRKKKKLKRKLQYIKLLKE
ncbi:PIR protein, putative [Plasmodium sp. gorilla clade G1]|nr:PIR protein, putative [Plasmodium sp. gorilla clade G1]